LVVAAGGPQTTESAAALETLRRIYWYPLYAFVRGARSVYQLNMAFKPCMALAQERFSPGALRTSG
jgi:hypothetical protein